MADSMTIERNSGEVGVDIPDISTLKNTVGELNRGRINTVEPLWDTNGSELNCFRGAYVMWT